jgi:hypothetical protein
MAGENIGKGLADGMTLGASATEKVGMYGVTPVVQPAPAVAVGTDLATVILELADLRASLASLGVIAS